MRQRLTTYAARESSSDLVEVTPKKLLPLVAYNTRFNRKGNLMSNTTTNLSDYEAIANTIEQWRKRRNVLTRFSVKATLRFTRRPLLQINAHRRKTNALFRPSLALLNNFAARGQAELSGEHSDSRANPAAFVKQST